MAPVAQRVEYKSLRDGIVVEKRLLRKFERAEGVVYSFSWQKDDLCISNGYDKNL